MDDVVLNTLLTAEWQLIHAYDAATGILAMPPAGDPGTAMGPVVLPVCLHFQSQHRDHAAAVIALITQLGGTPVPEASVPFSQPMGFVPGVANALRLVANLEKSAAVAYTNAQRTLTTRGAQGLAVAAGGVEAQHFAVMYVLARGDFRTDTQAAAMGASVAPQSFVVSVGNGTQGLDSVPDYVFL